MLYNCIIIRNADEETLAFKNSKTRVDCCLWCQAPRLESRPLQLGFTSRIYIHEGRTDRWSLPLEGAKEMNLCGMYHRSSII